MRAVVGSLPPAIGLGCGFVNRVLEVRILPGAHFLYNSLKDIDIFVGCQVENGNPQGIDYARKIAIAFAAENKIINSK